MTSYHTNLGAGINGLSVREHDTPEPGLNEVQVRASSLNSRELMVLRGWYPLPVKPDVIPISDGAGDVVAVPLLPGRAAARQGRDRTPLNRKGLPMATRNGSARWTGDLSGGAGRVTVGDGAWTSEYSFASRFDDGAGTNPEELIAAAHAGCFSMALCHVLTEAGHAPRSIETVARVHLRLVDGAPTIQQIDLETQGDAPGLDEERFRELAETAKAACAVSRALRGVERIGVSATVAEPPAA